MSVLRIKLEIENREGDSRPPYRMTVGDLLAYFNAADPNSKVYAHAGEISIVPVVVE